jgi:hypothetical protein
MNQLHEKIKYLHPSQSIHQTTKTTNQNQNFQKSNNQRIKPPINQSIYLSSNLSNQSNNQSNKIKSIKSSNQSNHSNNNQQQRYLSLFPTNKPKFISASFISVARESDKGNKCVPLFIDCKANKPC